MYKEDFHDFDFKGKMKLLVLELLRNSSFSPCNILLSAFDLQLSTVCHFSPLTNEDHQTKWTNNYL